MSKKRQNKYDEKTLDKVFVVQDKQIKDMKSSMEINKKELDNSIFLAEQTLLSLGKSQKISDEKNKERILVKEQKTIVLRTWLEIHKEAEDSIKDDVSIHDIFTKKELESNEDYLIKLRKDFDMIHKLDKIDYAVCATSAILSAAVDILLVGMPAAALAGEKGGSLSNYIRNEIDNYFTPSEISKLERDFWVPYDPSNNRNLKIEVEGLSSYFHRYQSLGHDPILGFFFGVMDVMKGTFSAIDKNGKFIRQTVVNQETAGMNLFEAVERVFGHLKSDIATPRGLPVPFMTLLNLFQSGKIGEEGLSIAEMGRSMYGQGYDLTHFFSMSLPVALNEIIVRMSYFVKNVNEGKSFDESLPMSTPNNKKPKLGTMLFISHSLATAVNAGKVTFTGNPLAINYPQWLAFAKQTVAQLHWVLKKKPDLRDKYVSGFLENDWVEIEAILDSSWDEFVKESIAIHK